MAQRIGRRQPSGPRSQIEMLEGRAVPAGDVAAFLLGGNLIVLGDQHDNAVEIRIVDGDLVVRGQAGTGTTVNGGTDVTFGGVGSITGSLVALLRGGNDLLDVLGIRVARDVAITTDAVFPPGTGGDDQVLLDQISIGRDLLAVTGGGKDAVLVERTTAADDTAIATGAGDDRLSMVDVIFGDRVTIDLGSGADRGFLDPTAAVGPVQVLTASGNDLLLLHGVNTYQGTVTLDGGRGQDSVEIDEATVFAAPRQVRGFETVGAPAVTEFSVAEGLSVRRLPFGDPAGTGSSVFTLNGGNFAGAEVTFTGIGAAYASAPTTYIAGPSGATITFDTPVEQVRFFFVHFPGAPMGTATAYDAAGNVVAVAQSNQTTFIGDPGNFVTLAGRSIARVVIRGGLIDNVSFSR